MSIIPQSSVEPALEEVQSEASEPLVSEQQSLSPYEVERICKAFIRLLHAPLKKEQEKQSNDR